eukprot:SAG25_NODE_566_length_6896_cov_2.399441_3_plen_94_part_00
MAAQPRNTRSGNCLAHRCVRLVAGYVFAAVCELRENAPTGAPRIRATQSTTHYRTQCTRAAAATATHCVRGARAALATWGLRALACVAVTLSG